MELTKLMTLEEKTEQYKQAIKLVGEYKKAIKKMLYFLKRQYQADDFFKDFFNKSDCYYSKDGQTVFQKLDNLDLTISFKIGSRKITFTNNTDKSLKFSTKLLSGNEYFDFLEKELGDENEN